MVGGAVSMVAGPVAGAVVGAGAAGVQALNNYADAENKKLLEEHGKNFGKQIRETYGSHTKNTLEDFMRLSKEIIEKYNYILT
jgi:predicted flavoprotein YhiN